MVLFSEIVFMCSKILKFNCKKNNSDEQKYLGELKLIFFLFVFFVEYFLYVYSIPNLDIHLDDILDLDIHLLGSNNIDLFIPKKNSPRMRFIDSMAIQIVKMM